ARPNPMCGSLSCTIVTWACRYGERKTNRTMIEKIAAARKSSTRFMPVGWECRRLGCQLTSVAWASSPALSCWAVSKWLASEELLVLVELQEEPRSAARWRQFAE